MYYTVNIFNSLVEPAGDNRFSQEDQRERVIFGVLRGKEASYR